LGFWCEVDSCSLLPEECRLTTLGLFGSWSSCAVAGALGRDIVVVDLDVVVLFLLLFLAAIPRVPLSSHPVECR